MVQTVLRVVLGCYSVGFLLIAALSFRYAFRAPRNTSVSLMRDFWTRLFAPILFGLFWPIYLYQAVSQAIKFQKKF